MPPSGGGGMLFKFRRCRRGAGSLHGAAHQQKSHLGSRLTAPTLHAELRLPGFDGDDGPGSLHESTLSVSGVWLEMSHIVMITIYQLFHYSQLITIVNDHINNSCLITGMAGSRDYVSCCDASQSSTLACRPASKHSKVCTGQLRNQVSCRLASWRVAKMPRSRSVALSIRPSR